MLAPYCVLLHGGHGQQIYLDLSLQHFVPGVNINIALEVSTIQSSAADIGRVFAVRTADTGDTMCCMMTCCSHVTHTMSPQWPSKNISRSAFGPFSWHFLKFYFRFVTKLTTIIFHLYLECEESLLQDTDGCDRAAMLGQVSCHRPDLL